METKFEVPMTFHETNEHFLSRDLAIYYWSTVDTSYTFQYKENKTSFVRILHSTRHRILIYGHFYVQTVNYTFSYKMIITYLNELTITRKYIIYL